jgi:hypothetical protein
MDGAQKEKKEDVFEQWWCIRPPVPPVFPWRRGRKGQKEKKRKE